MAFDFSIDGVGIHAGATGAGVSINDLAGLGLDVGVQDQPGQDPDVGIGLSGLDGGDTTAQASPTQAGPEGDLVSLLGDPGQQPQDTAADTGADATPASAEPGTNGFDPETLSSLTLLGGADDTTDPNGLDHLTGA